MMLKRKWVFIVIVLFLVIGLGIGPRSKICVVCDGQGGVDLTFFGIRIYSLTEHNGVFDEYGTVELWEYIRERSCTHIWHYRTVACFFLVSVEHGPPLEIHFVHGNGPAGLRVLSNENTEWAEKAWDALRMADETEQLKLLEKLEHLGALGIAEKQGGKPVPPHYIVYWWQKNGPFIDSISN